LHLAELDVGTQLARAEIFDERLGIQIVAAFEPETGAAELMSRKFGGEAMDFLKIKVRGRLRSKEAGA
jgi:hypothetical protein